MSPLSIIRRSDLVTNRYINRTIKIKTSILFISDKSNGLFSAIHLSGTKYRKEILLRKRTILSFPSLYHRLYHDWIAVLFSIMRVQVYSRRSINRLRERERERWSRRGVKGQRGLFLGAKGRGEGWKEGCKPGRHKGKRAHTDREARREAKGVALTSGWRNAATSSSSSRILLALRLTLTLAEHRSVSSNEVSGERLARGSPRRPFQAGSIIEEVIGVIYLLLSRPVKHRSSRSVCENERLIRLDLGQEWRGGFYDSLDFFILSRFFNFIIDSRLYFNRIKKGEWRFHILPGILRSEYGWDVRIRGKVIFSFLEEV